MQFELSPICVKCLHKYVCLISFLPGWAKFCKIVQNQLCRKIRFKLSCCIAEKWLVDLFEDNTYPS